MYMIPGGTTLKVVMRIGGDLLGVQGYQGLFPYLRIPSSLAKVSPQQQAYIDRYAMTKIVCRRSLRKTASMGISK